VVYLAGRALQFHSRLLDSLGYLFGSLLHLFCRAKHRRLQRTWAHARKRNFSSHLTQPTSSTLSTLLEATSPCILSALARSKFSHLQKWVCNRQATWGFISVLPAYNLFWTSSTNAFMPAPRVWESLWQVAQATPGVVNRPRVGLGRLDQCKL